jgi:hypothetical protein
MFKLKELAHILLVLILFAFIISFLQGINAYLIALAFAASILFVNIISKKLLAAHFDCTIEQKIWHFQRWGLYERSKFKKAIPIGIILPFLLSWISYPTGFIRMLTFLQFEPKPTAAKAAKRHGLYRFSEMTEWQIAAIAGIGIFANFVLAVIAYLVGYPDLARYSIYFSVWNMIPLGQLDGCKILFGSKILWILLTILSLIGLFFAFFLV